MAFAILRTAKLTSLGNIKGSLSHNFRTRPTPNADPDKTQQNLNIKGIDTLDNSFSKFEERLATVKTVRKNAVLAIEYLITHSPEHNNGQFDKEYFRDALKWLREKHGSENVFCATIHLDETTPHMAAYVIPIDERGKLNASKWLDGRKALSDMQTDFAEQVGLKHGLERGIEGSQAKHQSIKKYYSLVNEPLPEIKTQVPEVEPATLAQKAAEAIGIETEHSIAIRKAEEAKAQRQAELKQRNDSIIAKAKDYDGKREQLQERDKQLTQMRSESEAIKTALEREKEKTKQLTDEMREIPLTAVLERLGGEIDAKDRSKWIVDGISISQTAQRFKSFTHDEIKGGGAITLVRQVRGYDFNESIKWLSDNFGEGAATADYLRVAKQQAQKLITETKQPSEIPKPEPKHWEHVRNWLLEVRKLPEVAIDTLHAAGRLFADKFKNAVFLSKNALGAEIVGTREDQRFKGFRGSKDDPMTFAIKDIGKGSKVAIVESQIDAISAVSMGFDGAFSTSGGLSEFAIKSAKTMQSEGVEVYAAFDNDKAGREFQLKAFANGIKYGAQPQGKDWNDDLRAGIEAADIKAQKPQISRSQDHGWSR